MQETFIIGLVHNISMLLVFTMLYDYFWIRTKQNSIWAEIVTGLVLSLVGILLLLTPWTYKEGLIFDTRSILLSISGLIIGPIPTLIAISLIAIYRYFIGGTGVWMGIAVIISSGLIGVLWRTFRPQWKLKYKFVEVAMMGIVVHLQMLLCTFFLPPSLQISTLQNIFLVVLVVYPIFTVLISALMFRQSDNWTMKNALDLSEERLQYALDAADEGIWDWFPQKNEFYFSPKLKAMLGYVDADIPNKLEALSDLLHPDDKNRVMISIAKFISGEVPHYEVEQRLLCEDNSYKWTLAQGRIMNWDLNNTPERCMGTHKDISDRKEKELLLAQERFLLESLMSFAPQSIYFKDLESKFIRVNKAFALKMDCKDVNEIIGKSDYDFFCNEYANNKYFIEQEIIKSGVTHTFEEFTELKDGSNQWTISNKMPLQDLNGSTVGTLGFSVDITDRKKTEIALQESENYTNSILRAIPDMIFILDKNYIFNDFRTGNKEDPALPRDQFVSKAVSEVFPRPLSESIMKKIDLVMDTQTASSLEYKMEVNGVLNDYESLILPFATNKVIATVRNITERKQVESELKDSQRQLKKFAGHLQSIREEERVSLAREIHDELGQILIALKIDLGIFKQQIIKNVSESGIDDFNFKYNAILEIVNNTIKTTRKIMTGLRPEMLDIVGFTESAQQYLSEFSERYQIKCEFRNTVINIVLDSQQSLALFRILQESLTNIAKHSKATQVVVVLQLSDGVLEFRITDNGVGFNDKDKMRFDSYGLLGMKERVYLLNGKLCIKGNPGVGAEVCVEMPYLS